MDRRQFLTFSAASVLLTACGGGGSTEPSVNVETPVVIKPPVTSKLTEAQWKVLSDKLGGQLILPTNEQAYPMARLSFSTRFDHIYPQAVVRCSSVEDVKAAILFAKEHDLHIAPRSGSHSYGGYSTTEGIIIDVTDLSAIQVTGGFATVGAGARLADVYDQLTAQGVCIPAGSCLSVGIAGLTLGGGFGVVDRAYGLTCDTLESAEIVTASGEVLTCSLELHPDLFWALRGGGGGNFGIVTAFKFKTHATSDITVFEANFNFGDFEAVMGAWQTLADKWPNEMWAQCLPTWLGGSARVNVRAFCVNTAETARQLWQSFITQTGVIPTSNTENTHSYRSVMLGRCESNVTSCHLSTQFNGGQMQRSAFGASSDFFNAIIPPTGVKTLKEAIEKQISDGHYGMIIFNLLGGKIDALAANQTAYPHRGAIVSAEYYAPLQPSASDDAIDRAQAKQNEFRQTMAPWSSGGAYVNYIDPLITDWENAYYGDNYFKLQSVKAKYDADSLFRHGQSIKPA
jgi:hypothetical protein